MTSTTNKVGWSVEDWCLATSLGRTKTFALIAEGSVRSVTAGRRRIIITPPIEFLEALSASEAPTKRDALTANFAEVRHDG